MLPIAGQTAGLIGLNFLWTLMDGLGLLQTKKSKFFLIKVFFHGHRRALQIVMMKTNVNENSKIIEYNPTSMYATCFCLSITKQKSYVYKKAHQRKKSNIFCLYLFNITKLKIKS